MRKWLAPACILLMAPGAQGQTPPPDGGTPQWTTAPIETIEATNRPGPAVWRIAKGDAEVWILPTVGALPRNFSWNKDYVAELLDGARAVITPPGVGVGIGDAAWLLINYGNRLSLPRGQALEATMEPGLRAHFVALRTLLGREEDRYRTDSPFRAALRLSGDFRDKLQLTGNDGINRLARDKKVPFKPAAERASGYDLVRDVLTLPTEKQRVCLSQVVDDLTYQSTHAAAAARAWAVGDIRAVKANLNDRPDIMECVTAQVGSLATFRAHAAAAEAASIEAALDQKGKTIMLLDMREFLRKGGVLEQLEARHLTIEGPAE
ncbi:MAG: TraB/GumN family protein [Alphaproteobacteria bacterium]|nr:TraB/GumN family protein [Alphaproteobacteria bacterium]